MTLLVGNKIAKGHIHRDSARLGYIDLFRGITIVLMILVNTPGNWHYVYGPLKHAMYNGWTTTDLVFPFFIFAMGLSIHLSIEHYDTLPHAKIIKRVVILFLWGIFLNNIPINWDGGWKILSPTHWRIFGVLQRLSIVYFFLCYMTFKRSIMSILIWSFVCVLLYGLLLLYLPFPFSSHLSSAGSLEHGNNLSAYIDSIMLNRTHLFYQHVLYPYDPEGILSTIPSLTNGLLGVFIIRRLTENTNRGESNNEKSRIMSLAFIFSLFLIMCASLLTRWFPINKTIWSPSFTCLSSGAAILTLLICWKIIDISWLQYIFKKVRFLGKIPLFSFLFSIVFARIFSFITINGISLRTHCFIGLNAISPSAEFASFFYSVLFLCLSYMMIRLYDKFKLPTKLI